MSLVKGENFIFYIFNTTWKMYVCARSGNMSINTDTIETTAPGNGNYKTFKPTVHSFTASIDGVISLNVTGSLTLPELQALQLAKTKLLCRFTQTSQDGDVYTKECYFYITNSTDTGSFDGVATFSLSLQGTGGITQIYTPPTPITPGDMRYPEQGDTAPATTGAYTWSLPGLNPSNTKLTNVVKDGRGSNNIILSGTPVGNEVLFEADGSDGLLTWSVPFEDGETPPYVTYTQI
jgi:predicted secreted protein